MKELCRHIHVQYRSNARYKARVITHAFARTCTLRQIHVYVVKWVYTRRQTCSHKKANSFALYLASDLYCTCTYHICIVLIISPSPF